MYTGITLTETDRLILHTYKSVLDGLAEFLGGGFEFVLHSLENFDSAAIKVINGHYTGRREGAPITDLALRMLGEIQRSGNAHKNLIYFNRSKKGTPIRSATLPITGEQERIIGLLCINFYQDIPLHTFFESLFSTDTTGREHSETFASSPGELLESAVAQARAEVYNNPTIASVNKNRAVIELLYEKDLFRLKDAVAIVSELLGISKNTVYLHIRHIQAERAKE